MTGTDKNSTSTKGFTLIELLVVVSIIGILISIIFTSLGNARSMARDTQRISDMRQIRTAMQLFYNDHGRYPDFTHDGISTSGEFIGVGDHIDTALLPYINPVPKDPSHDGVVYFYAYDSLHNIDIINCSVAPATAGVVFGFNRAEIKTNLQRETCNGTDKNLNNADFNEAIERTDY